MKIVFFPALVICLFSPLSHALLITNDKLQFLAEAAIEVTQDFSSFMPNTGYLDKSVVLGGVLYSTRECESRCWGLAEFGPQSNKLLSNLITSNILSFGENRSVNAIGFEFSSTGRGYWDFSIIETDGSVTDFLVQGSYQISNNMDPLYFGFQSAPGIAQISITENYTFDGSASNWYYDDVSRSAIVNGPALTDCEAPLLPPGLGGPPDTGEYGESCVQEDAAVAVPEPDIFALIGLGLILITTTKKGHLFVHS
jgi:hypothetical protein